MVPGSSARPFPVRPDLAQLEREAEASRHASGPAALADAQQALALSYGIQSWERLVLACRMTDAIWNDDIEALRELVTEEPELLFEDARGVRSNWGPPMSYAANLGRDRLVLLLHQLGARDLQHAFERACLQGRIETGRRLYELGARPIAGSVMGPCETLNADGLALQLELGASLTDALGDRCAPVAMLLQSYSRAPEGKHRCLEIVEAQGIELPDTPALAVHRGRIDLLEAHLAREPGLFRRTFAHQEFYPPELGCSTDESLALHGTPLAGATLLHLCVDMDEIEIARWMFEHGAEADARAALDSAGFGGHTALFGCIVSQSYRANQRRDDGFARLLLDQGADPNARASLRKRLRFVEDETLHEYPGVTPLAWGQQFHEREWVNLEAMRLVVARGGRSSA